MIPSVTEALSPYTDFSGIRPEVLEQAAKRGSRFHAYVSARLQGLFSPSVDDDIAGFVESWERWAAEMIEEVVLVEIRLHDDTFGFHGKPDGFLRLRGDRTFTVVDWKTPVQAQKTWEPQVSAYRHLGEVAGYEIGRQMSVRPDRDGGRAKVIEYTRHPLSLKAFLGALSMWRFMNE